ncbi:B12-binding domain-containing radical SAM protein [Paraburkholderia adhaesiva]|uniref:B12-binding domain-containing radical SAM protein n=1 Tax=Paraburkholderia adhaesiva TaxID=2883244 RepID=UPI001F1F401B|nr:radical SAM protein [Paraburkholderia adhaesiva]
MNPQSIEFCPRRERAPNADAVAANKKKLLLIYPPLTMPTSPPLGAPLLKGYIERELPEWEVKVIDLNIWSYGVLFERIRDGSLKFAPNTLPRGAADVADLLRISDFFRGKGPDEFYLDGEAYDRYGNLLLAVTKIVCESLGREADAWTPGGPIGWLVDEALQKIWHEHADCYGISMIFNQQLPIGAMLGRFLRMYTRKKVIFGGSCFTAGAENFLRWYPESADVIVDGDGEEPLKKLLLQDCSPEGVPGAVLWKDGKVVRNISEYRREIDAYSFPDFSDLELDRYYSPVPVVPLLLSRGCYWRRCTFCVHYMSAGLTYRVHGLEHTIEMLRRLVAQGIRHFSFVDEMIAPGHFAKLADAIIESGLEISYYALSKPNKTFTPEILQKMARSGCKYLLWGLESGTQRILDLMDKGTRIEEVELVLRNAYHAGIANHVYVICGFPTETREEFQETLRFLERNREYIFSVHRGTFALEPGSPIFKNGERFGIKKAWIAKKTPLGGRWAHECTSGMTQREAAELLASVQPFLRRFHPYAVTMANYRDHAMLLYAQRGIGDMRDSSRAFPNQRALDIPARSGIGAPGC